MSTTLTTSPTVHRLRPVTRVARIDRLNAPQAVEAIDTLAGVFGDRSGHVDPRHQFLHDALTRAVTPAA